MIGTIGFTVHCAAVLPGVDALLQGVPALAWRFADNSPVLKAGGGYWLKGLLT